MSKKNSGYGMLTPIHFLVLAGVVIGAAAALSVAENASLPEVWTPIEKFLNAFQPKPR